MILEALRRLFGSGTGEGGSGGDAVEVEGFSCEEALSRVFEFLDGELPPGSHEAVAEHFRVCERCYPHLELERAFRETLQRALRNGTAPEAVRAQVIEMLDVEV